MRHNDSDWAERPQAVYPDMPMPVDETLWDVSSFVESNRNRLESEHAEFVRSFNEFVDDVRNFIHEQKGKNS